MGRALVLLAACAVLAAGCGGGSTPRVAGTTPTTTMSVQNIRVAFTGCMRANGVPRYPDDGKPTPQQAGVSPARFDTALNACKHLLPNGGQSQETAHQIHVRLEDGLSFARCMRGHGLNRFPDPNAQGDLTVEMVQAQGIDVHAPQVLRVVQTCLPASHGMLTPAKVREALNHTGG